jgi:hypothetical protein
VDQGEPAAKATLNLLILKGDKRLSMYLMILMTQLLQGLLQGKKKMIFVKLLLIKNPEHMPLIQEKYQRITRKLLRLLEISINLI